MTFREKYSSQSLLAFYYFEILRHDFWINNQGNIIPSLSLKRRNGPKNSTAPPSWISSVREINRSISPIDSNFKIEWTSMQEQQWMGWYSLLLLWINKQGENLIDVVRLLIENGVSVNATEENNGNARLCVPVLFKEYIGIRTLGVVSDNRKNSSVVVNHHTKLPY